jgi:hypothetical protein
MSQSANPIPPPAGGTQQPGTQPAGGAPPGQPPPANAAPPPAPPPQTSAPPPSSDAPPPPDPNGEELIKMPARAFSEKIRKYTKRALRDDVARALGMEFPSGTSKEAMIEALKARQVRFVELEKAEEERKKAEMTTAQRYEYEKNEQTRRAEKAERRLARKQSEVEYREVKSRIKRYAAAAVAPEHVRDVLKILKTEIRSDRHFRHKLESKHSGKERLKRWFADKAKELGWSITPAQADAAAAAAAAPDAGGKPPNGLEVISTTPAGGLPGLNDPRTKKPLNHGAPQDNEVLRPAKYGYGESDVVTRMFPGKTMKPGMPNSLTPAEVKQVQDAVLSRPMQAQPQS